MQKLFCVYMMSNRWRRPIYTGMSSDLPKRGYQHKMKLADGFTKKYSLGRMVFFEVHEDAAAATHREKCIKEWKRDWKIRLIEENNPAWRDLYDEVCR